MPHEPSTAGHKSKSSRRRNRASKDNDSTKTHRGSPAPQPPDVSDHNDAASRVDSDKYNPDFYLLGFGAQFDDKK
ncbi:uncharacterized protein GGS22DRAFT_193229 [Annulohypoxylon maeteangense]|uniref:uncharacterized protein n=1 Tax=Annulohypoxylon maeteangense TaxID=1927788 RepID=UPI002008AF74|nr:uncharacterized protein GGS22DRAFT_193229 [Annulohypoxylon maeteangense]KAI0880458.1 hypothetical protein GGS22DRAFT_193229 [Annulohypoxylon maeteangense]